MSRSKKSRNSGDPQVIVTRNRTQLDVDSRQIKKAKKRKGLAAGSRHSAVENPNSKRAAQRKDPRHGSKKPVPLIIEAKKPQTKAERRMSAEQELAMLENDPQLIALLDRLDAGETLGAGLQKQVDTKLDRIEQLMKQLGLFEEPQPEADEMSDSFGGSEMFGDEFETDLGDFDLDSEFDKE